MKRITVIGLLLIAVGLLSFIGCSKDSGTEYGKDDLIGKWQAVEEELDLSAMNMGKVTLTPTNPMFFSLIFEMKNDGTFSYEMWNGPDQTAEGANYRQGAGSWTATSSNLSLDFEDPEEEDISGSYKFANKNRLEVETTFTTEAFSPGTPISVPATLYGERVTS
jgi:hypothetical protein